MQPSLLPIKWHDRKYYGARISPLLATWLCDYGSLTERLRKHAKQDFSVRVLSQTWQRPSADELLLLPKQATKLFLIREVELLCDGIPWVFARSVFPKTTVLGRGAGLKTLGKQPLINVLAQDRRLTRSEFQLTRVESLWARRSIFYFFAKPLVLTEIFLPQVILSCQKTSPR